MAFIWDRTITHPSSHTAKPATLWAVPRTERSRFSWRAKFTAWTTSSGPAHRAMSAGRRSIETLNTARAASYCGSSGTISSPRKRDFSWLMVEEAIIVDLLYYGSFCECRLVRANLALATHLRLQAGQHRVERFNDFRIL